MDSGAGGEIHVVSVGNEKHRKLLLILHLINCIEAAQQRGRESEVRDRKTENAEVTHHAIRVITNRTRGPAGSRRARRRSARTLRTIVLRRNT